MAWHWQAAANNTRQSKLYIHTSVLATHLGLSLGCDDVEEEEEGEDEEDPPLPAAPPPPPPPPPLFPCGGCDGCGWCDEFGLGLGLLLLLFPPPPPPLLFPPPPPLFPPPPPPPFPAALLLAAASSAVGAGRDSAKRHQEALDSPRSATRNEYGSYCWKFKFKAFDS